MKNQADETKTVEVEPELPASDISVSSEASFNTNGYSNRVMRRQDSAVVAVKRKTYYSIPPLTE